MYRTGKIAFAAPEPVADGRVTPLRVDARRNLRHVLIAARDVFGEQGYDAPMEEVARRARVGVGTVYRRFPNKEALVRFIADEETERLIASAREALASAARGPWNALAEFVQRSAASGTGRLLPPELLAASVREPLDGLAPQHQQPRPQVRELLAVMEELVERTQAAGELRADATVADVMLVIATTPPVLADPAQRKTMSARLLDVLLQGLRATPR